MNGVGLIKALAVGAIVVVASGCSQILPMTYYPHDSVFRADVVQVVDTADVPVDTPIFAKFPKERLTSYRQLLRVTHCKDLLPCNWVGAFTPKGFPEIKVGDFVEIAITDAQSRWTRTIAIAGPEKGCRLPMAITTRYAYRDDMANDSR